MSRAGLLAALAAAATTLTAQAGNLFWQGGTASYNTPGKWGGVVPGAADYAINASGSSNNLVQVNNGDPDWTVGALWAGRSGDGGFLQNGQTLRIAGGGYGFNLGFGAIDNGLYTLNDGTLNYGSGNFNVGLQGSGTLNINGGTLLGSGRFAVNVGAAPIGITASMDAGERLTGTTWIEQGFDPANPNNGVPAPGTSFTTNVLGADHSYTFAPSYTKANNAVMISSNGSTTATITLAAPVTCSALSFLGSSGNGPINVAYTVHYADNATETGIMTFLDWFNAGGARALATGGRANGDGTGIGSWPGSTPYLFATDIALTHTGSAVKSIDLAFSQAAGNPGDPDSNPSGQAAILAVSSSAGGAFTPVTFTGYNQDMIIEKGLNPYTPASVVDTVTQTGGSVSVTNELWIGNGGNGIYNLSGGSVYVDSWLAVGRSSGNGVLNVTGGTLYKRDNGNVIVGTGFGNNGNAANGTVNQSGGTVTIDGQLLIPENSPSEGWYYMNGGTLIVNNWLAVGRNSAKGHLLLSDGLIVKGGNSGNHFTIGSGGIGELTQTGGTISNTVSDFYVGQSVAGTWNFNGGQAILGRVVMGSDNTSSSAGTLKLNNGVFQTTGITSPSATPANWLVLNGATLQAGADNASFINSIDQVDVASGGAIIDSQNHNITIPQVLSDAGGGLTKTGSGTLTLAGANTYSGDTLVNAGTLMVTTEAGPVNGNYLAADNAGFGVQLVNSGEQFTAGNVALGASGAALNFALGSFGNPTVAPLNVADTLTIKGTVTVNIASDALQPGTFPLAQYGTLAGTGSFVLGSLPVGVTASLVNDTASKTIKLNVSSSNQPRWNGNVNGNWDISATANWINMGSGAATVYDDGNVALFDDNAAGTTTVNLAATVKPYSVTVNNSNLNYTIAGAGKISGATGVTKLGGASLSVQNNNDYTGPTVILGGTLSAANLANGGQPSAVGAASANPANLVIANATFSYAGAPVTVDRGYTATNATIDVQGDLTLTGVAQTLGGRLIKTGPAKLTYAGANGTPLTQSGNYEARDGVTVLDGSAGATFTSAGDVWVGSTPLTDASLILTNTSLRLSTWLAVGRGNGTDGHVSRLTLYNSALTCGSASFGYDNNIAGNTATQIVTLYGNSTITNNGDQNIGESTGSAATLSLHDNSIWWGANRFLAGQHANSSCDITIADSSRFYKNGGWFSLAVDSGCTGSLVIKNSGYMSVPGDFNLCDVGSGASCTLALQDNAQLVTGSFYVGKADNSTATVTQTGGTVNARTAGEFQLGRNNGSTGIWNQTGGTNYAGGWLSIGRGGDATAKGSLTVSGGVFDQTGTGNGLMVGESGTGTLTINNTGLVIAESLARGVAIGMNASGNGTLNLNGGTLVANLVQGGNGNGTFNWNGGTLRAGSAAAYGFIAAMPRVPINVQSGAVVDTDTNTVAILQPLLNAGPGGLTKLGSGTLHLNAANTYIGDTLVNVGTLGGSGTIAGAVKVASGATLAAGDNNIGALSINGALTLQSGSSTKMRLGAGVNDQIKGLTDVTYSGTLVVTNTTGSALASGSSYQLFIATGTKTGNFTAVTILPEDGTTGIFDPATGILTIKPSGLFIQPPKLANGNLTLTGMGGTPGSAYTVLSTTNLATPLANWTTTTATGTLDGAGAFSNNIPVSATEPDRFYIIRVQ